MQNLRHNIMRPTEKNHCVYLNCNIGSACNPHKDCGPQKLIHELILLNPALGFFDTVFWNKSKFEK